MPTPESALFLAKKPKVAPTFDGVDYEDNVALKGAQDAIIREQWVQSMMARLVREEMGKCYRREGVNHLEKCGPLRGTASLETPSRKLPLLWPNPRALQQWLGACDRSLHGLLLTRIRQSATLSSLRVPRSRATFSSSRTTTMYRHRSQLLKESVQRV